MATDPQSDLLPIFDGHNDVLESMLLTDRPFYQRSAIGHTDRVRAAEGGLIGGFHAIGAPSLEFDPQVQEKALGLIGSELDGASIVTEQGWLSLPFSQQFTNVALSMLLRLESGDGAEFLFDESTGDYLPVDRLQIVLSAEELEENIDAGNYSVIVHFEGAEAIDANLYALDTYHAAGLRSLGIVWSRPNRFGHGVPFAFPSSPDTGPGLTEIGKELVTACNDRGIMVDLSHLNEKGFWDVAAITDAPLVATHSNVHALCQSSRNLTDKQLDAIRESDGVVGLNFHVGFLNPDGSWDSDVSLDVMADHMDYLIERLGIDRVAIGSDFDGATMPSGVSDASKLPNLIATLRTRGYDDASLRKIGYQNWIRVLKLTLS